MDAAAHHVVRPVVGLAVGDPRTHAAAGHPHREAPAVVVAPAARRAEAPLAVDRATELPSPDDQGVLEQPAPLEVHDERRARLVGVLRLRAQLAVEVQVLVPAPVEQLHHPHATLQHPPREQAVRGIGPRTPRVRAVQLEGALGLAREIRQLGHRGLHPVRHLVLVDARLDLGIPRARRVARVQPRQVVQLRTPRLGRHAGRVLEVEDRVGPRAQLHALVARREEARAPQPREERLARVLASSLGEQHEVRG